ncbi:phospholipid-translocating ATPase [Peniophora sp. CONT]|nr:phospholipid-translocating ATPase [Peniophora sp. CONT]
MPADDEQPKRKSLYARFRDFSISNLFERTRVPGPPRSIFVNQALPQEYYDPKKPHKVLKQYRYTPNQVITSKYTILTFIPRDLLEQFRRIANIFFLVIAILQFNSKFSTISAGLVILPLIVVIAITALKDAYEDYKRHQSDRKVNYSEVRILAGPGFENPNAMSAKSRTFVRALPFRRKRKTDGPKGKKNVEMLAGGAPPGAIASARRNEPQTPTAPMHGDGTGPEHQHYGGLSEMMHPHHDEEPYWETSIWENLKVGDIVKLKSNEAVPADILVCATSEEENVAFVETKNLDGETNLKSRTAVSALTHMRTAQDCVGEQFIIEADRPEPLMHKLNAAVVTKDGSRYAVDLNQVLLRGTIIRNTEWVIGVVMYTGYDTKLVLNAGGTPSKRGRVERQMDPMVAANLGLLAVMATVCAIVDSVLEHRYYPRNAPWLYADNQGDDNPSINGVITWVFALITFQNIVPISLYISIEVVRTAQAAFIYFDKEMYYAKNDTPTLARNFVLSDDLGQIEYIFSDKTGTLTQNAMVFRRASVGAVIYSDAETNGDEDSLAAAKLKEMESNPPSTASTSGEPTTGSPNALHTVPKPWDAHGVKLSGGVLQRFSSPALSADIAHVASADTSSFDRRRIEMFWTVLALCHTVLAGVDPLTHQVEYKAQSPDEAALVQAAADIGFEFRGRDRDVLYLRTPFAAEPSRFRLLNILDFTSARKRMSVLLRAIGVDGQDVGPVLLFSKGADNVIFERLQGGDDALKRETEMHLDEFASSGLRTLTLAYRTISETDYMRWNEEYLDASSTLENREDRVEAVSSAIEQDLRLLGATGIEDRLQDGVPETIADLKAAGIKVWVLTGDKLETAIAIGHSTNLISPDANIVIVRGGKVDVYEQMLRAAHEYFPDSGIWEDPKVDAGRLGNGGRPSMQGRRLSHDVRDLVGDNNGQKPGGYVLVIDGLALEHALSDAEHKHLLLRLGTLCQSVVCCRVSPKQKALVVTLVKDGIPGTMTLAIGDGANDVSMIQAADVGVGISGEEGLQAVNSSDYAIPQFRFLKRLLLVHGHWSYYRNGNMINNFFYKNIICIGVLWWFQIYCGWSSAYYFDYTFLLFWNSFWTIAPVIGIGIFDRLIDERVLMAIPELYRYGRERQWFSPKLFFMFIFDGIVQSAIIFFIGFYTYETTSARTDGFSAFQYESATVVVIAAAMTANFFNGLNTNTWTWWIVFAVSLGPVLIWLWQAIYSSITPETAYSEIYGDNAQLFGSAYFWLVLLLTILLALLPRYIYKSMTFLFAPTDIDVLRWNNRMNPRMAFDTEAALREEHKETQRRSSMTAHAHEVDSHEMTQRRSSATMAPIARTQTMGSQIDMSTGVRGASRGFGFSAEEGGVEMRRIQSHLSSSSALAGPNRKRSRGSRLVQSIRRPLTGRRKNRRPTEIDEEVDA